MSEITNEIAVIAPETLNGELASLNEGRNSGFYSSIKATDFKGKLETLNAMSNSQPLAENLNKAMEIVNIIIQSADMTNETTGEVTAQPRITFITKDGKAFHAISSPLYRDVKNWFGTVGAPSTWPAPLPVKFTREGTGTSKFFKASLAL